MKSALRSCLTPPYGAVRAIRNVVFTSIFGFSVAGAALAADLPRILALGDSLTAGYGLPQDEGFVPQLNAWLAGQGVQAEVINAGVSGDTTAGGAARLEWSLADGAQALIVNLGGNDLLRGLPPAAARANLTTIMDIAKGRDLPVLLVGMQAPGNFGPDYKAEFEAIYPDLAAQYGALFLPVYFAPIATAEGGLDPAFMQADGIHPNAEGVQKIVVAMGPKVLELLEKIKP
ncbi:arylesterase [Pseudorhodobacter sp. E13]|uniref:arylesterase n=1 Tax=Pseudorhodobacter sp. E13 TaxID=2487931 RepID=UPI000F8EA9B2|nr:arylesterase [Pseudorhodobacter sp. E13]RUS58661.1 arylesterase [Pseudorhodobacter sp. E13]